MNVVSADDKGKKGGALRLELGERIFSGKLQHPAFMIVRLKKGRLAVKAALEGRKIERIVFTPPAKENEIARRFAAFEKRSPKLGVHLGFRRDCGSTLARVGKVQDVSSHELTTFTFEGAIDNYPRPDVQEDNDNYLAGVREIGVRGEYTDGRDMPRLLIRSIEFEGPFYESWPPKSHRAIFVESEHDRTSTAYAREVIGRFASRAYRRPATKAEIDALVGVFQQSLADGADFDRAMRDALLVTLTSPQFLFLIESSDSPAAEPLDDHELASKFSYFLWNSPPDSRLLGLAAKGKLRDKLDAEAVRMLRDERSRRFLQEFASQWLQLDKFDVVEIDRKQYPKLTRDTRAQLRDEPIRTLEYMIRNNRPYAEFLRADYILANEATADYYGMAEKTESGFEFVPVKHENARLGGVLTQAAILSGLSDGRESNPVKRGAWLARKIIAEPPDDPPPNVPGLPENDDRKLTLREKLFQHRNQKGCLKCHSGIDPWGLPLEEFDAGGLFKKSETLDVRSTLPDRTAVKDTNALKAYLAETRLDQSAFSFLKHLATYAVGRTLTYKEIESLRKKQVELKPGGYRMQEMIRFVVRSELFLEK